MIAELKPRNVRKRSRAAQDPAKDATWHPEFLRMLPAIHRRAHVAFRHLDPEARSEAVEDVVAHTIVAFKELWDREKAELAYPSVLARYGIKRVKSGRKVGTSMNVRDVSSACCQITKGLALGRLDRFDKRDNGWMEVLVEDRHAGPAETAASRIDFPAWLKTLSKRKRRIAWRLALGETTRKVAKAFGVTDGRISQIRREMECSWLHFHGELAAA